MAVDGIDILKDDDEQDKHKHVFSVWMNYRNKPKPAQEYRVCQVFIKGGQRCPHYEIRDKANA